MIAFRADVSCTHAKIIDPNQLKVPFEDFQSDKTCGHLIFFFYRKKSNSYRKGNKMQIFFGYYLFAEIFQKFRVGRRLYFVELCEE